MRIQQKPSPIPFTKQGLQEVKKELDTLLEQRPDAVGHLKKAREMGDLRENGYYQASRAKLSFIDSRIRMMKHYLAYGVVADNVITDSIDIGSQVVLTDGETERSFKIVGQFESNPLEGKLSHVSPLGRQLMGKKNGESVVIETPSGKIIYTINSIK